MPAMIDSNRHSRRTFLAAAGSAAAAMALPARGGNASETVHWALLADTHIPGDPANEYRGFRPYENLQTAVPQVLEASPDAALINGDLARLAGLPDDYANLKALIEPLTGAMPVCMALGNHDDRDHFREAFSDHPGETADAGGKHVLVVETPPARILALDSLLYVDKVAGLLGKSQREWLRGFLAEADEKPTLVFFHHTPGDGDGDLLDIGRVMDILLPARMVKAVFFGHSHHYGYSLIEDIHMINLPAVGYNFNDDEPVGWVDALIGPEGADLTLRAFGGNTAGNGRTTRIAWRV